MSDKYVIELDDEKISIEGHSYRKILGTHTLICDDEIKNLTPIESKEKKKTIKDIAYGDRYFFINSLGDIETSKWRNDYIDEFRVNCSNVFLTEDEAEFEQSRLKVLAIIRKYAEPFDTQWDGKKPHYELLVQVGEVKKVTISCSCSFKSGDFYFATGKDAKKVITEVGEADLLKYYFMVED